MYASISQLTPVCNMQLNVLDDLAEAMKALDGKKEDLHAVAVVVFLGFVVSFYGLPRL